MDVLTIYGSAGGAMEAHCWTIYNLKLIDSDLFEKTVSQIEKFNQKLGHHIRHNFVNWKRSDQEIFRLVSVPDLELYAQDLVAKIHKIESQNI